MSSREEVINTLPQGRLPDLDLHLITNLDQRQGGLPEGMCDMRVRSPIRVKGEQDLSNLEMDYSR